MTRSSHGLIIRAAELLNNKIPYLSGDELKDFVQSFLDRKEVFISALNHENTPLYIVDIKNLCNKANKFMGAFSKALPRVRFYYAVKSNNHQSIINALVDSGMGLDVSSGKELEMALSTRVTDIIFSGPGKTADELELAAQNAESVTVLLDSFNELKELENIAARLKTSIRCGIRLTTDEYGIWRKFGIPISKLAVFFETAAQCKWIKLQGLQFHLSWNLSPESHIVFIARLSSELRQIPKVKRDIIQFIDIGGGFWPEEGEWLQTSATPIGILKTALGENTIKPFEHFKREASSISDFASHISKALKTQLPDDMNPVICLEPGRWLSHGSMHILLTVADKKAKDLVITDGGTNAIGWDRFETDYFPVINLTNPALDEKECLIAGSLCTPHDIWGYGYFGESIDKGDVLLIPNQGAYTYSLKQNFIKPLPGCFELS